MKTDEDDRMTPAAGRRLVAAIAAVTLLVVGCGGVEPSPRADPRSKAPRSGNDKSSNAGSQDLAPDFSVKTFEGSTFRLSDHRGTPVVLNFWESW